METGDHADPAQIASEESVVWEGSQYYDDAERWLWLFWKEGTDFFRMFSQLDISNIVELACGHGRHSEYIVRNFCQRVSSLLLMDILQSNIDYCRGRIHGLSNVGFRVNDGAQFTGVSNESVTAIFCYDAMVHFHRSVVKSYLVDAVRVLVPGGKALFHHSNYCIDPDAHFSGNPHARAFMSAALFRTYSVAAGLEVVEQKVIPWGNEPTHDCLTLVQKPIS